MIRHLICATTLFAVVALSPISAAAVLVYRTYLDGPSEPTPSPGTGFARVDYDDIAHTMRVRASFKGLEGVTTAAHIHAPTMVPFEGTASVATTTPTFLGFPAGVAQGSYDMTLDLTLASSWRPGYLTANGGSTAGAETAFISAMENGQAYFNIHSSIYGGGEIRGFFVGVPEPATMGLVLVGAAGALLMRRRQRLWRTAASLRAS
jgi:hypothetical protein